jgi:hypothetical protein
VTADVRTRHPSNAKPVSFTAIATGYGLGGWCSNPGKGNIFLFSTAFRPALGPTQPPIQWVPMAISPGVKRPGLVAEHSPPTSTEGKIGGAIPALPIRFRGVVHRDSFTFYVLI